MESGQKSLNSWSRPNFSLYVANNDDFLHRPIEVARGKLCCFWAFLGNVITFLAADIPVSSDKGSVLALKQPHGGDADALKSRYNVFLALSVSAPSARQKRLKVLK